MMRTTMTTDDDERGVLHLRLDHGRGVPCLQIDMAAGYYASVSAMAPSRTWPRGTQALVVRGGLLPGEDAPTPPLMWLLWGRAQPPVKYCVVGSGVVVVVVVIVIVVVVVFGARVGVDVDVGFRIQNLLDQWPLFST